MHCCTIETRSSVNYTNSHYSKYEKKKTMKKSISARKQNKEKIKNLLATVFPFPSASEKSLHMAWWGARHLARAKKNDKKERKKKNVGDKFEGGIGEQNFRLI